MNCKVCGGLFGIPNDGEKLCRDCKFWSGIELTICAAEESEERQREQNIKDVEATLEGLRYEEKT